MFSFIYYQNINDMLFNICEKGGGADNRPYQIWSFTILIIFLCLEMYVSLLSYLLKMHSVFSVHYTRRMVPI